MIDARQSCARRSANGALVHLPVHASWLDHVETYHSIIQRKVLAPPTLGRISHEATDHALGAIAARSPTIVTAGTT